jgi:hypothetical protein
VANQNSNTVVVFRVDKTTGRVTHTGQRLDNSHSELCVFRQRKIGSSVPPHCAWLVQTGAAILFCIDLLQIQEPVR